MRSRRRVLTILWFSAVSLIPCHGRIIISRSDATPCCWTCRGGAAFDSANADNRIRHHDSEPSLPGEYVPWRRDLVDRNERMPQNSVERRRLRTLTYRDILNCDARQWALRVEGGEDMPHEMAESSREKQSPSPEQSYVDYRGRLDGEHKRLSHSPVVYQYYGRSRIRGNPSDSVHFILLGPNVDHWKTVGQTLASRGFNTIACERLEKGNLGAKDDRSDDTPNLVLDLMEALKWKKVILVGCDTEAILAMETAMMLSPDQVVGLVLSGDLTGASQAASESRVGGLDSFLQRVLDCPFLIVWDGDTPTVISGSSAHRALETESSDRCVILGGGSAPHRLKPEQFAWVLTRFVEEKLSVGIPRETPTATRPSVINKNSTSRKFGSANELFRALRLPFGVNAMVSPEGRLLLGRAVAAALFYVTAMRVVFVQYGIIRSGLFAIKSRYESIDALTKRSFQAVGGFIINFGYIPRLFTLKRANDDEEDENRRSGTIVLKSPEPEENNAENGTQVQGDTDVTAESDDNNRGPHDEGADDRVGTSHDEDKDHEQVPLFKPFFFLDNIVT